jgi:Prokaryotic E2 family D
VTVTEQSSEQRSATVTVEDLGTIAGGRKKHYVIPLPTNCKSIVVSYNSLFKVSCVLPAEKRAIRVSSGEVDPDDFYDYDDDDDAEELKELIEEAYTTVEVDCPSLLFCTRYRDIPAYGYVKRLIDGHSIFCLNDEVKTYIEAAPYIISNVYKDGNICFGANATPDSPRKAFNIFWNSPFNDELYGESGMVRGDNLASFVKNYHDEVLAYAPWEDFTDHICGRRFWASPRGAGGLLISDKKELLKKIPKKYWRKGPGDIPFIIALAEEQSGFWQFTSGNFKFSLNANSVRISESTNRRASAIRKKLG